MRSKINKSEHIKSEPVENEEQRRTTVAKLEMIEAMTKSLGVVTSACKLAKCSRTIHYEWMKEDPEYKAAIDDISEMAIDFAESQLHKKINGGDTASILFYLKCKAKARGYIERSEIESTHKFDGPVIIDWNTPINDKTDSKTD